MIKSRSETKYEYSFCKTDNNVVMQFSCEGFLSPTFTTAFHARNIHTVVYIKGNSYYRMYCCCERKRKTARIILKEKTVMQKIFVEGGKSTFSVYALKSYCRPPH